MKKKFDCVEMKQRGAERLQQRLSGMTLEQEIEYWRQRSDQFQQDQERLSVQPEAAPAPASPQR